MYNILIVGVGGQGTLLASRVLGTYASLIGKDCKLSEVHGMAQRGGSVVTHVRIDDKVFSPIISEGNADIIIAFEKLEALRWRHYLKKDGILVVNDTEIYPMPVIIGARKYPNTIIADMIKENINVLVINANEIAMTAGNVKTANTVMIGALAKNINLDLKVMEQALITTVPQKFRDLNLIALQLGYNH